MIGNKKVLALIPARGGSKSIPKKNIAEFCGKPLISWTIETALNIKEIDKVIVSTDNEEIASISKKYGAQVSVRPSELATDTSLVIETIKHVMTELKIKGEEYDYVVLLETTSPLRNTEDVKHCIHKIYEDNLDSVATFKEADLNPHRAWKLEENKVKTFIDGAIPWLPRQELPEAYQLNGAVYVTKAEKLMLSNKEVIVGEVGAIIMPKERSVDIDDSLDFTIAELILKKRLGRKGSIENEY